ncbi:transposase [Kiritimatiellota bacterium B12222]|nr:transposase [Kiritimatiellota bacterium B12222]
MKIAYYHPKEKLEKHGDKLPHWQQAAVPCFITWRLADALPVAYLRKLKFEEYQWTLRHPKPWDSQTQDLYNHCIGSKREKWLDRGLGRCVLRRPDVRQDVAASLHFGDSRQYQLMCYVIMPNHLHLFMVPDAEASLGEIMFSIKSYTASRINKLLGERGAFWQEKYWDRLIRSPAQGMRVVNYIRNNPGKAHLGKKEYTLWEREDIEDLFRGE